MEATYSTDLLSNTFATRIVHMIVFAGRNLDQTGLDGIYILMGLIQTPNPINNTVFGWISGIFEYFPVYRLNNNRRRAFRIFCHTANFIVR